MYKLIHYSNLIKGKRYLIKDLRFDTYERFATFNRSSTYLGYVITIWQKIKYTTHLTINDLKNNHHFEKDYCFIGELYLSIDHNDFIYELVSEKKDIQQSMEQRAVNLLLQKITGDKNFIYSIYG